MLWLLLRVALIATGLCKGTQNDGPIPVNKVVLVFPSACFLLHQLMARSSCALQNLWSLSFILLLSAFGTRCLAEERPR